MHKNIEAIIFDWGGVCCARGEPFASLALQEHLRLSPRHIGIITKDICEAYYTGKYDGDEFWECIMERFKLHKDCVFNKNVFAGAYLSSYRIYEDILDFILYLRNRYKTYLLSNLTTDMRRRIQERHHLENYFDLEVYSCDADVQSRKPSYRPFKILLEKIKIPAERCLLIDDSKKNIKAASQLGMSVLLFKSRKNFFKEMQHYR